MHPSPTRTAARRLPAAPPSIDLLAVGQLFLDVLYGVLPAAPSPGQEVFTDRAALLPGGIANFAAAGSALGARTAIAARIGDGPISRITRTLLEGSGIDTTRLLVTPDWDLQITSALPYAGDRALVTGGSAPTIAAAAAPDPRGAASIALHLGPEEMPWLAASDARIWADVGWDASGAWDPGLLRHLEHCEGFLPNADEAMAYTRTDSPSAAAHRLAERVPIVVVTCGAEGALGIDARSGLEVAVGAPALGPVDPTGAGDTFGAALIVLRDRGLGFRDALEAACLAASARAAGLAGPGITPSPSQLAALARQHRLGCTEALEALAATSVPDA
ncbi:carbohydrate kinase family protein [Brachybacterium vulturis]|uniref:Carbohydrate kinase family protein n=1 Tax=Brachybacterium vulturis TaxID=2017484 RepID=A0A291GJG4_9MICO|nr:PfkB family carbohydrate kinase [Brachybacterium vulturis]ATG50489.1 carbohydrate kinase family protein [Brachybacterium vulturis]